MALVLQKGAIPSAQPEAGLTLLLDEEVQTSVRCPEQEISGFLPFIRGCCGCLHVPVSQGSGGCSILDEKLWKSSEDLATNCYRNWHQDKWHQDFFRVCNGQVVQPEVQVLVFLGPFGTSVSFTKNSLPGIQDIWILRACFFLLCQISC